MTTHTLENGIEVARRVMAQRDTLLAQVEQLQAERDGAVATATCVQRQHTAAQRRRDVLQGERDVLTEANGGLRDQLNTLAAERDTLLAQVEGLTTNLTECYQCGREVAGMELSHRSRCVTCEAGRADFNADENDGLRAQVTALRDAIVAARSLPCELSDEAGLILSNAVLFTPAQSVAHIEAAALRRMATAREAFLDGIPSGAESRKLGASLHDWENHFCCELVREADRIEQAAKS